MTAYRRNMLVGAVMLVALVALGWMIIKFGGGPATWFTPPQMSVRFVAERADGIADGSNIFYRGVVVGRVISTELGGAKEPVVIQGLINREPILPGNLRGVIRTNSLLGSGASIDLAMTEPKPTGALKNNAVLQTEYAGTGILPPEFSELANELRATARQLRDSGVIEEVKATVTKVGHLSDSLNTFVSDKEMRDNLTTTVANLRTASENATRLTANLEKFSTDLDAMSADASATIKTANTTIARAGGHVDDLSRQLNDRLIQAAELLKTFNSIAAKVDQGQGTAGLLVNDPKLYDSLVDTSRSLNLTIADLKRLVNQWETEGAYFRLSK